MDTVNLGSLPSWPMESSSGVDCPFPYISTYDLSGAGSYGPPDDDNETKKVIVRFDGLFCGVTHVPVNSINADPDDNIYVKVRYTGSGFSADLHASSGSMSVGWDNGEFTAYIGKANSIRFGRAGALCIPFYN